MNFASDNTAPVCPEVMQALGRANEGHAASYGADALTAQLTATLREIFETDLAAYPVATGTAANALALSTLVHPYGAVICADEAHIATDECGAPEFYTAGAKLIALPAAEGRITAMQIESAMARAIDGGVHHVLPEAVSLTQATEWGTIYTPDAIEEIGQVCRRRGLHLHMDGARFANALATLGCTPAELSWKAGIDVLSFGATKNGAMAAEAVLFFNPALAAGFERRRKRAAHLWSKQRYLSAQLTGYLEGGAWLSRARHANGMATALANGVASLPNVRLVQKVQANEVFVAMPDELIDALHGKGAIFYRWIDVPSEPNPVVRLVTNFTTTRDEVAQFLALTQALAGTPENEAA